MENRDTFLEAGGDNYQYIPCLNSSAEHIDALAIIIERAMTGWSVSNSAKEQTAARAIEAGARR